MEDLFRLLYAFGLTVIIEYPIVQLLWLAIIENEKSICTFFNGKFIIIPVLIVNVLTNPAINIFARYLWRETDIPDNTIWIIITILEFVIWSIEAVVYKYLLKTKWSKAFLMAISANFVSYMCSFFL